MSLLASTTLTAGVTTEVWRVDKSRSNITFNFADRSGIDQQIRLWIVPIDVIRTDDHAWLFDRDLPAKTPYPFPLDKITLDYGVIVYAYASGGLCSLNIAD